MTKKESQNGSTMGINHYTINEKVSKTRNEIGRTDILAAEDIEEASVLDYLKDASEALFL